MNYRNTTSPHYLSVRVAQRSMYWGFLGLATLASIFITYVVTTAVYAEEVPAIELSESRFDFGTIAAGTEVEHDFIVKNVGKGELRISGVQTG